MPRGDLYAAPHKRRKLAPSASAIDPNSSEYSHIFKGLKPPVDDDNTPESRKILDEWRCYVVHHYLLFVDSLKTQSRRSGTLASPSPAQPISPDPKSLTAEDDVQMVDDMPCASSGSNMDILNTSSTIPATGLVKHHSGGSIHQFPLSAPTASSIPV